MADTFLQNAQEIFDVACAGAGHEDFAVLVNESGGLHFLMNTSLRLDAAAAYTGCRTAYRVTRSRDGVRVEGQSPGQNCVLENRTPERIRQQLLPNTALYRMTSPLLGAGSMASVPAGKVSTFA